MSSENWSSSVPAIVQRWMHCRGLTTEADFENFTNFSLKDLSDPKSILDMDKAVDRLIQAFENNEKICLYADFDMDGTPGLALLIRGLQYCGFNNLVSFQPNRFDDGYGVHPDIIEDFIDHHGVSLFVTVDVGITDVKAVELAAQKSVDFIITDHHQQKEILPPALAIVNPNRRDCTSDLKQLCGTGVAFYLILALRRAMTDKGILEKNFDPKKLLDCFAIATLTDMVPLVRENRTLVQHGLLQLTRTERLGIRALMEELGLAGKTLSSADVAIGLAPKLNALGRMNSSVQALDVFLSNDKDEALQLIEATMQAQSDRTEIQKRGEMILDEKLSDVVDPRVVCEWSEDFYKGVVGLLATQATKKHNVPSFVGSVIGDKVVGSARAPKQQNLLLGLEACSEILNKFGGHKQAAGFELNLERAEEFKQALQDFYQGQETIKSGIKYDFQAELAELDKSFVHWFKKLEPYGVGFSIPLVRINHLFVASVKVLKEKHLKFVLKDMQGNKIDALWFFADNIDERRQLSSARVSVVVEPSINFYMGRESLQVFIRDLKVEYS